MKKYLGAIIILTLVFLSCETGIEVNLSCTLKHTTEVINLESDILGPKNEVFINLSWKFNLGKPEGDSVIVQRSIGDSTSYTTIATVAPVEAEMYYNDNDTLLTPENTVYYRLGLINAGETNYFISFDVQIPPVQHFYEPSVDTLGDTLNITFAQLSGFDDCEVAIYKSFSTDPESLAHNLTNPLFDTTLTYPDTSIQLILPDSIYPDTMVYTIKLLSSKVLDLITDSSFGFRAFFKKP